MRQLARRYARALLSIAVEENALDRIERDLAQFGGIVSGSPELKGALADPTVLPSEKKEVVSSVLKRLDLSQSTVNFIGLLAEKGRLDLFEEIRGELKRMADEHAGRARAVVTSTTPLAPDVEAQLRERLSKMTGRTVELAQRVDPDLLGGLVAEVGGVIYDGSLRTQLRRLHESAKG